MQLTVRGIPRDLEKLLCEEAALEGVSLNKVALRLMARAAGLETKRSASRVGASLEHLMGAWSTDESLEFDAATAVFSQVDESFWQ